MLQTIKKSFFGGLTFFLTVFVLSITYAATIGTVSTGDPLTETLWNTLVGKVNEIGTPPVFTAELSSTQSPIIKSLLTDWTVVTDNKTAFSAGKYTVPKNGYYRVSYDGLCNHGANIDSRCIVYLYVNNINISRSISSRGATTLYSPLGGINRIIYLTQGSDIELHGLVTDSASYIYSATYSNFTIEYIGE